MILCTCLCGLYVLYAVYVYVYVVMCTSVQCMFVWLCAQVSSVYLCGYMHKCPCLCKCMWRPVVGLECFPQLLSSWFFWDRGSPSTWNTLIQLDWLATKPSKSVFSHRHRTGTIAQCRPTWLVGCWALNLCPQVWQALYWPGSVSSCIDSLVDVFCWALFLSICWAWRSQFISVHNNHPEHWALHIRQRPFIPAHRKLSCEILHSLSSHAWVATV